MIPNTKHIAIKSIILAIAAVFVGMTVSKAAEIYQWIDADGVRHYANTPPPEDAQIVNRFAEEQFDPQEEQKIREAEDRELAKLQQRLDELRAQREQARLAAENERARQQEAENQRRIQELEKELEELKRRQRRPVWIGPYLPKAVPYPQAGNL
jgi:predicted RNase H-like nuclease (RuvC/YqgF family)